MSTRARAPTPPLRLAALLALFLGLVAFRMWPRAPVVTQLSGKTMGTTWAVKVVGLPCAPQDAQRAVAAALDGVDQAMSTWKPDSELSRLNRHEGPAPFPLSKATREVLELSLEVSQRSGGAFDVTVGPLVDAWGFGPPGEREPPTEDAIAALREVVGSRHLELSEAGVTKAQPRVRVDLSAVAKGYGVDRAAAALEALGARRYLVEVGGELRARGLNAEGAPWQVGVERPDPGARAVQRVVPLIDAALATSGDYRNFFERGGRRFSHTIDPRTGRPIEHALASVSVVADTCARADAWATALNVLGPDEGLALARRERLSAWFVSRQADGGLVEEGTGQLKVSAGPR